MTPLLAFCSIAETLTGLTLLVHPPLVVGLLFGTEIPGVGVLMSRLAGIALVGLGVACWPRRDRAQIASAAAGLLVYSLAAALYLALVGVRGQFAGVLLWPAVGLHVILTVLLARGWFQTGKSEQPADSASK